MRAAVLVEENNPLVIEELRPAPPGPHDVVVEIIASGVCHSDLSIRNGFFHGFTPQGLVLGHEASGRVVEVGDQVSRLRPGARVVASIRPTCGDCWFCLHDQTHLCDRMAEVAFTKRGKRPDGGDFLGMAGLGTFSEMMTCHEWSLVEVQTDLPDEQLALLSCGVSTGVGAVLNTAGVPAGSTVAVVGCGGVGQSVIQGARIAGASRIIAVDPVASKRSASLGSGATDVIDPAESDPAEAIRNLTNGRGVDYAFEVVGSTGTVASACASLRKGGMLVLVGLHRMGTELPLLGADIQSQEKTIRGCAFGSSRVRRDIPRLVEFAERGQLDLPSMVTQRIHLDEVNDAFDAMENGEVIRSVITSF